MTNEKRISSNAYQALREALPVVFHYKRSFESFLRSALRDHPELLAGINFGDLKRYVADEVVRRLVRDEARYQQTTIDLMVAIAGMERFPDLERHDLRRALRFGRCFGQPKVLGRHGTHLIDGAQGLPDLSSALQPVEHPLRLVELCANPLDKHRVVSTPLNKNADRFSNLLRNRHPVERGEFF
jgi:hypothetical protein